MEVGDRFPMRGVGLAKGDADIRSHVQEVVELAPGRAPDHSQIHDEIVYIIDGEQILHLGGQQRVVGQGSAVQLSPPA